MNLRFNILDNVKSLYSYRDEPERMRVLADLYWQSILVFVGIVTVCSVSYGLLELSSVINPESQNSSASTQEPDILDKRALQAVLAGFTERTKGYQTLKETSLHLSDPAQ